MRQMTGDPDSFDEVIDRSPSLSPKRKTARATVTAAVVPMATARERQHQKVLDREHDSDRIVREMTARQLLQQIEDRALCSGKEQILAQLLIIVARAHRGEWASVKDLLGDWIEDASILRDHLGKRTFSAEVRNIYFRRNNNEAVELARIRRNLSDATS